MSNFEKIEKIYVAKEKIINKHYWINIYAQKYRNICQRIFESYAVKPLEVIEKKLKQRIKRKMLLNIVIAIIWLLSVVCLTHIMRIVLGDAIFLGVIIALLIPAGLQMLLQLLIGLGDAAGWTHLVTLSDIKIAKLRTLDNEMHEVLQNIIDQDVIDNSRKAANLLPLLSKQLELCRVSYGLDSKELVDIINTVKVFILLVRRR